LIGVIKLGPRWLNPNFCKNQFEPALSEVWKRKCVLIGFNPSLCKQTAMSQLSPGCDKKTGLGLLDLMVWGKNRALSQLNSI